MTNRVAEIRRAQNISQTQLAELAGISRPYLSDIETGKQQAITNTVMFKLVVALATPVEELFSFEDVEYS